jgi:hypothetical protein
MLTELRDLLELKQQRMLKDDKVLVVLAQPRTVVRTDFGARPVSFSHHINNPQSSSPHHVCGINMHKPYPNKRASNSLVARRCKLP